MKIRAGFVSNSSSTSFLIIAKEDLNRENFYELMGVAHDSPIADLFSQLYDDVIDSTTDKIDFKTLVSEKPAEAWFETEGGYKLSPHMLKKVRDAKKRGLKVYFGHLDSETSMVQTFFCTDSFEVENEDVYFNALECVW